MNEFKNARAQYEKAEIPAELNDMVQAAVSQTRPKKKSKLFPIASAAAVIIICFTVALNTNQAFAMEAQELPIIGTIAKLLTVRSYETVNENHKTTVEIPAVIPEHTEAPAEQKKRITDINAEIERSCKEYLQEAELIVNDYKNAFLETGGTEEEWLEHDIQIKVDYAVKSQSDTILSFVVYASQNWSNAYTEERYYNIDLTTGNSITLEDLLGSDYIKLATASIFKQMDERLSADESLSYFDESMGGFTTISEDSKFYINEKGNPVIVFAKYEIAPGAFGPQEFEIEK